MNWRSVNVVFLIFNAALAALPPYGVLATCLHLFGMLVSASTIYGLSRPALPRSRTYLSGSSLNADPPRGGFNTPPAGDPFHLMADALRPRAVRIADLEHDGNEWVPAMFPLGNDPTHCGRCRSVAESRARQAACPHRDIEHVDIGTFGNTYVQRLSHCSACGKPTEDT